MSVIIQDGKAYCECCKVLYGDCRKHIQGLIKLRTPEGRKEAMDEYNRWLRLRAQSNAAKELRDGK